MLGLGRDLERSRLKSLVILVPSRLFAQISKSGRRVKQLFDLPRRISLFSVTMLEPDVREVPRMPFFVLPEAVTKKLPDLVGYEDTSANLPRLNGSCLILALVVIY